MRVGVVVLHFRFWPEITATLDALDSQSLQPLAVVVSDNGSDVGDMTKLTRAYPGVQVLPVGENAGYARGMNLGARALPAVDAYFFLTHECVLAPDALQHLVDRLGAVPQVGIVGPLLGWRSQPERVWSGGGGLGRRTLRPFHLQDPPLLDDWSHQPRSVAWIDGAAMLVRREAFEAVGGFDEGYFLYDEELELALRAARAGWRVECVPTALAWQEPGMVPPYLETRNRFRLLSRNRGLRKHLAFAAVDTVRLILTGLRAPRSSAENRAARLRVAGLVDLVRGRLDRVRAVER